MPEDARLAGLRKAAENANPAGYVALLAGDLAWLLDQIGTVSEPTVPFSVVSPDAEPADE